MIKFAWDLQLWNETSKTHYFVISTEGRNHTRNSAQNVFNLYRILHVISPFGRNDTNKTKIREFVAVKIRTFLYYKK
ncbi:hypothetical protein FlaCF_2389 [Flavobacterium tructae]